MSMNEAVWQERHLIAQALHAAIIHGMLDTWSRCGRMDTSPQEPDFVAGLVLESCPLVHAALSSILADYGIRSSLLGVYCHQTPKVTYQGIAGSSCELGDLLVAHVHASATGHVRRNALLYQAKVSSAQPYRLPIRDKVQLRLYAEWPDFEYYNSPPLTGQRRHVTPKMVHAGAQYMLIDDRPPTHPRSGLLGLRGTYPIGSCMPDDVLRDHNHLAGELLEFLLVRSGRPFEDRNSSSRASDWSRVVWDLLEAGVRKSFNRKLSGRRQDPRVAGDPALSDGLCFASTTSPEVCSTVADILGSRRATGVLFAEGSGVPPETPRIRDEPEAPEGGVSLLLLETSERREG
jgi:hypothetical protein